MTWEEVFMLLEDLGFTRAYSPEDQDGNELVYQEGLFQFVVGEQEVIQENMTAADVIRQMVRTLTDVETQEQELTRLFGTKVRIIMDGEPGWTPAPAKKGNPFTLPKRPGRATGAFPPPKVSKD